MPIRRCLRCQTVKPLSDFRLYCGRYLRSCQACETRAAETWRLPAPRLAFTCPHCAGRAGACCVCGGTGRVDAAGLQRAVQTLWARPGCVCAACQRVGPSPTSLQPRSAAQRVEAA